jgi:undecaprenyl pyrophosphate synthase
MANREVTVKKSDKLKILNNRMQQLAMEKYNQELNLKMYYAYGERDEVIQATQKNIEKQKKSYAALEKELTDVEALKD